MAAKFHEVFERYKAVMALRSGDWNSHFQDLAEYMLPPAARFTSNFTAGSKVRQKIYDSTQEIAARGLVSAVASLIRPRNATWLKVKAVDPDLNEVGEAKQWLEEATEIQRTEMYRPRSRLIKAAGETDRSLVVFGTGALFSGETRDLQNLSYRSFPLWNIYIGEDADGNITLLYAGLDFTVRQAATEYGLENLGGKLQELHKSSPDTPAGLVMCVQRREERNPRISNSLNLEFSFVVLDVKSEKVIDEGGFHEFPFVVPRWDTISGEVYARSPGMMALPDTQTLQVQGQTILRAGHMQTNPPMLAPDGSIVKGPYMIPGRTTYYNASKLRDIGLRDPIRPMSVGGSLSIGRDMQQDSRDQIFAAFFRNVFNLPIGGPQMTAREIIERKEEFIREMGPIFGQLESDYTAPLAERSFGLLARAGKFPEPPPILRGQDVRFELASPIEETRKQIELLAGQQAIESIAPFINADPSIMDNFDGDQIARDANEISGAPSRWLLPVEERDRRRQQRAEAQDAALAREEAVA